MAKQTRKQQLSLDLQFQQLKDSPGWTDTLLGDLIYIHSNGKSRDFYKLNEEEKKFVIEKLTPAQEKE